MAVKKSNVSVEFYWFTIVLHWCTLRRTCHHLGTYTQKMMSFNLYMPTVPEEYDITSLVTQPLHTVIRCTFGNERTYTTESIEIRHR